MNQASSLRAGTLSVDRRTLRQVVSDYQLPRDVSPIWLEHHVRCGDGPVGVADWLGQEREVQLLDVPDAPRAGVAWPRQYSLFNQLAKGGRRERKMDRRFCLGKPWPGKSGCDRSFRSHVGRTTRSNFPKQNSGCQKSRRGAFATRKLAQ